MPLCASAEFSLKPGAHAQLDTGTTTTPTGIDTTLEALGEIHRRKDAGRQEKFKKAEALAKDKEKALVWIENIILVLREKIILCHSERPTEAEESHTTK